MVEVLHRLSLGCSCHGADPVIVDSHFVILEEFYLGFLQQLRQLRDIVLPLLLPALRERFRRAGSRWVCFFERPFEFSEMHTDRLLRDAHPTFPLDFVGIFAQKSVRVLLGIFGDALAFLLMNLQDCRGQQDSQDRP